MQLEVHARSNLKNLAQSSLSGILVRELVARSPRIEARVRDIGLADSLGDRSLIVDESVGISLYAF